MWPDKNIKQYICVNTGVSWTVDFEKDRMPTNHMELQADDTKHLMYSWETVE